MDIIWIYFIISLLTAASGIGIIVSAIKLHKIKKGAQGRRAPWIILIIICSLYMGLIAVGLIYIIMLMINIIVVGM